MASRLVSARTVGFHPSRGGRIVAFGEAAGIAIQLTERALSNEVITPGKTTLEDVAWWMQDRLIDRALGSEFDMPSVYVTGPSGIVATSSSRIIQPGDVMMIDWGVQLMNFGTDVKRVHTCSTGGPRAEKLHRFREGVSSGCVEESDQVGVRADDTRKHGSALRAPLRRHRFNRPNKDDSRRGVRIPSVETRQRIGPSSQWPVPTPSRCTQTHVLVRYLLTPDRGVGRREMEDSDRR